MTDLPQNSACHLPDSVTPAAAYSPSQGMAAGDQNSSPLPSSMAAAAALEPSSRGQLTGRLRASQGAASGGFS